MGERISADRPQESAPERLHDAFLAAIGYTAGD